MNILISIKHLIGDYKALVWYGKIDTPTRVTHILLLVSIFIGVLSLFV